MAASADIDFYIESATRCFNEAKRLEPSLAAIGMGAMGQEYLKRAKQLYDDKVEKEQPAAIRTGSDSSTTRPISSTWQAGE